MADDVLAAGQVGSSAGGEQPKFLVARPADGRAALVKFSPAVQSPVGRRVADLLIAEHVALATMREHGQSAARTALIAAGTRIFLESERFDRLPGHGRRGVLSLFALDAQFVGRLNNWIDSTAALIEAAVLPPDVAEPVRWRQRFGELIGNSDMHAGNLSFFTTGCRPHALAPAYDVGPSLYAPRQTELPVVQALRPPLPEPDDGGIWASVCEAAAQFWNTVGHHQMVSSRFRRIARENVVTVRAYREMGRRLPGGA
jgi:hypothetical protein